MSSSSPGAFHDGDSLGRSIARFLDEDGAAVGAGLLLSRRIVATTAAVLRRAGPIRCDFPLLEAGAVVTGEPHGGGADPVVLVQLAEPAPRAARVPPWNRDPAPAGQRVRVFGFPGDMQDGVWTVGTLSGDAEEGTLTLLQDPTEPPIGTGFAGAAVWDDTCGLVRGLLDVIDTGSTATVVPATVVPVADGLGPDALSNPYRGLEVFEEEHAEFFCGRDADIERLTVMVERRDVVAVTGRSGSGKSSLLRAGLVPWLRRSGAEPLPLRADPEAVRSTLAELDPRRDIVVLLDQFEDLVETDRDAARRLLSFLSGAVGPTPSGGLLRACVTLRWNAWDELLTRDSAELLAAGTVAVAPMTRSELRDAIETPAARAPGPDFAAGLVDRILDDAGDEPGTLPLVETLLTQLWDRREGGQLTVQAYTAIGGVEGAIAAYAEHTVATRTTNRELPAVRQLLTAMARLGDDDRFVRRRLPLSGLDAAGREVLDRLVAGRLAVLGRDTSGAPFAELAHQALIDHWPRLRDWLAEDRDFLRWHADIERDVGAWSAGGRDHGALLRGGRLAIASDWLATRRGRLSNAVVGYILVSSVRARRETRRRRAVAGLLGALILMAGTLSGITVAGNVELAASNERLRARIDAANARSLGERSVGLATVAPSASIQLALAAWRSDSSTPETRTALLRAYLSHALADRIFADVSDRRLDRMTLAAGGRTAVVAHGSGYAVVTGLTGDRASTHTLAGAPAQAEPAVSPDGRRVATVQPDGAVRLWDARRPERPRLVWKGITPSESTTRTPGGRDEAPAPEVHFSPDSERLLAVVPLDAGRSGLRMWDSSSGTPIRHGIPDDAMGTFDAAWSTGSADRIVTRDDATGQLVVRRLSTGEPLRTVPGHATVVLGGRAVVTCAAGVDGPDRIEVRGTHDGGLRRSLEVSDRDCAAGEAPPFQLSADGSQLITPIAEPGPPTLVTTISLRDGRRYQSALGTPPEKTERSPAGVGSLGFVTPSGGGAPMPVAVSDRSLIRYRAARPLPAAGLDTQVTSDGRRFVADDGYGTSVVGRTRDGDTAATFTDSEQPVDLDSASAMSSDALVGEDAAADAPGSRLRMFDPSGRRSPGRFTVSWPRPDQPLSITSDAGRLVVYADARIGGWALDTGRPLGPPTTVTPDGREPVFHRERGDYQPAPKVRPGHTDQVLLRSPSNTVEVWDLREGDRIARLPRSIENTMDDSAPPFVVDGTGRLAAFVGADHRAEVWELDGQRRIARLDTSASAVLGFTPGGELAVRIRGGSGIRIALWDVHAGRRTGPVEVSSAGTPRVTESGLILGDGSPFSVSLEPRHWFRRLCALQDRPFTENERQLLLGDAETSRPCRPGGETVF